LTIIFIKRSVVGMRPLVAVVGGLAATALALSACSGSPVADGGSGESGGRLKVVAGLYPLAYAAQQVGGDAVEVTTLTAPGVEPHDLELSPTQVAQIADADVVLYVKGLQPAVDEAIAQEAPDRAIDVTDGLSLLPATSEQEGEAGGAGTDPHVWLYPPDMAAIGTAVASRLEQIDPSAAAGIDQRTAALTARMDALDADFSAGLADCAITDMVVSHEAFGYLAKAYGLTQVGLSGLDPEAEPSPARLKAVADLVRQKGVDTIYYETLVSPKVAQTIADETGATATMLDPIEGLAVDATGDYETIMRTNLATLQKGQHCS
jgi:zinc transport system substrate-binding protein